jgi:hypothetical protein
MSDFIIELACVESVIENELEMGLPQKEIAKTYAMGIVSTWPTDWGRVNTAITKRWPKGLPRVKEMAWKLLREHEKGTVTK